MAGRIRVRERLRKIENLYSSASLSEVYFRGVIALPWSVELCLASDTINLPASGFVRRETFTKVIFKLKKVFKTPIHFESLIRKYISL